ncbi:type II toxin-antitoxin system PemK/MazF family toxin [Nodosilinea sp. PGN35]|uniref:type II toxin-antitoxin system PemK/MazF family toxin n=1 Tax=Nodosilinea sp. PGN35 TaxID=3020489 RepID=UPI0023B3283A|nr:type II toxin-antitoxin system PemK/MazF family toxin [Nodosilinea sp. TSF1-S3]
MVVVPFPFSDLTQAKRRPALVLATLAGDDVILCQITSQAVRDRYSVALAPADFGSGSLPKDSNIRPNRLFMADRGILLYKVGTTCLSKLLEVVQQVVGILQLEA